MRGLACSAAAASQAYLLTTNSSINPAAILTWLELLLLPPAPHLPPPHSPRLPDSMCSGWRFVLIRGLCRPPLLSLAVQKGTNWQWANESPLSLSGAQLPPLHSGPRFSLPLLCFALLYLFPLLLCLCSITFPFLSFLPLACVRLFLCGLWAC